MSIRPTAPQLDPPATAAFAPSDFLAPLWRLPVDKPLPAVRLLQERGGGVMDLIAHFWERLSQTPPLQRPDLHLILAGQPSEPLPDATAIPMPPSPPNVSAGLTGAMLYVPKAHRADILALDTPTANAFVHYIRQIGTPASPTNNMTDATAISESASPVPANTSRDDSASPSTNSAFSIQHSAFPPPLPTAIDFLTGCAPGLLAMVPQLLSCVHKKAPARITVNVVMQLPPHALAYPDPLVRLAKDADAPTLSRWRKLYKEERGILFDADIDALIQARKVYVCADDGQVVALAKFDLDLPRLVEIGGVYTFPEYRNRGYGARIVRDLAARIRTLGKTPTLQVDRENTLALHLYRRQGWREMGTLARVWLTG